MTNTPLVTVGVALYNHNKYIVQCLESIIGQTYSNIEIIIVDDGSTDNSFQLAKQYLESQDLNKNYQIFRHFNQGICYTQNKIAKMAKGKYISFIGSDDFWFENKITEQTDFLEKNNDLALVHSSSIKVDKNGKKKGVINPVNKINSGNLFKALIDGSGIINTPSHLYRTSVYKDIGYYDANFKFEDLDFWLRLTKKFKIGFINTYHTYYRRHKNNFSANNQKLLFYHKELLKMYLKNITDLQLAKIAKLRIYRKSYLVAFRTFQLRTFVKNLVIYWWIKIFLK